MENIAIHTLWISKPDCHFVEPGQIVEVVPLNDEWSNKGTKIQYKQNNKCHGYRRIENFLLDFRPLTNADKLELL